MNIDDINDTEEVIDLKEMFLNRCIHNADMSKGEAEALWSENEQQILDDAEESLLALVYELQD